MAVYTLSDHLNTYTVGDQILIRGKVTAVSGDSVTFAIEADNPTDTAGLTATLSLHAMYPQINPCRPATVGDYIVASATVNTITGSGAGASVNVTFVSGGSTVTIAGSQAWAASTLFNEGQ